jgi:neutral ceramidase
VSNGPGFSADYVYQLRETLRRHYKRPDLPVGFLLGAAGDVTQVDNLHPGRESGPERAEIFGLALGAEVGRAVARMTWEPDVELLALRTSVPIPIRSEQEEPKGPRNGLGAGADAEKIYARERELVARERRETPIVDCEVQAIRIGGLGIATNGAEFFCGLGLDIKAASPFSKTWVVSLANDWVGYVPTASAYYAGGYEPRTARSAKLAPWAGQALVEGALAALRRIAPKPS